MNKCKHLSLSVLLPGRCKYLRSCFSSADLQKGGGIPHGSQSSPAQPQCQYQGTRAREDAWLQSTVLQSRSPCLSDSDSRPHSSSSSCKSVSVPFIAKAETADTCILAASATGKTPLEVFPCCHRVVQWIVSCKPACAGRNWDSTSFLKAEVLGEVVLKWEQDHLPPLVCDLFRHSLWFSIQSNFLVSKALSVELKWTLHCACLMFRCWSCFCSSVYEKYCLLCCHGLFCGTVLLI